MSHLRYYTKPRPVEAARWFPGDPIAVGAVLGLVLSAREDYEQRDERLVITTDAASWDLCPGEWLVLDEGRLSSYPQEEFTERFETRLMRGTGSTTNTITGPTAGPVIQAGDIRGDLHL